MKLPPILAVVMLATFAFSHRAASEPITAVANEAGDVVVAYQPIRSARPLQDEVFYLLTVIEADPAARTAFANDPEMKILRSTIDERISVAAAACETAIEAVSNGLPMPFEATACSPDAMLLKPEEAQKSVQAAGQLFDSNAAVRGLVGRHLRPSGYFARYASLNDRDLFTAAWTDMDAGIDRLVRVYGLGEAPRYPTIDGAIYSIDGAFYRGFLANLIRSAHAHSSSPDMPYAQRLGFAMDLMMANRREDAREQAVMQDKENTSAYARLKTISWEDYPYAAVLAPGHSPEVAYEPLNPNAKLRIRKAVEQYKTGKVAVIVFSGGHIRPPGTSYTEALEMKRYAMAEYDLPESAILIDPLARHTTTNLRNTARLLLKVGAPMEMKSLIVGDQVPYILSEGFHKRNEAELGYFPVNLHERLAFDVQEFSPEPMSMHRDAMDPLDP